MAHYVTHIAYYPEDRVRWFSVSFDASTSAIFFSLTSLVDGKAGNIWEAYVKSADGYQPLDQPVSIRGDTLSQTSIKGVDGLPLITYWPGGAEGGMLRAIQITDGKIVDHNLGVIEPQGKDKEMYGELFSNDAIKISVEDRPIAEVLASIAKSGLGHEPAIAMQKAARSDTTPQLTPKTAPEGSASRFSVHTQSEIAGRKSPWVIYGVGVITLGLVVWLRMVKSKAKR